MGIMQMLMSGGGGGSVDDVFSTDLWSGNDTARNITSGLDMTGEGGMVWIKRRNGATNPVLWDTERGLYHLETDGQAAQSTFSNFFTGFRDDGFSIGTSLSINGSGTDCVGWSFRKAENFFDIVTYTGNGTSGRTIAHNLGCTPGWIIAKTYSHVDDWGVYSKAATAEKQMKLNDDGDASSGAHMWNEVAATSSVFTVGNGSSTNEGGKDYVAYLFADNQDYITQGTYTGNGGSPLNITCGFEPQWVIIKCWDGLSSSNWYILDSKRGFTSGGTNQALAANLNSSEWTASSLGGFTSTGFEITTGNANFNSNGKQYMWMAVAA